MCRHQAWISKLVRSRKRSEACFLMRCGEGQARIPHLASSCSFPPADSSETAGVCERGQHRKQSETGPRKQLGHPGMPKRASGGPCSCAGQLHAMRGRRRAARLPQEPRAAIRPLSRASADRGRYRRSLDHIWKGGVGGRRREREGRPAKDRRANGLCRTEGW